MQYRVEFGESLLIADLDSDDAKLRSCIHPFSYQAKLPIDSVSVDQIFHGLFLTLFFLFYSSSQQRAGLLGLKAKLLEASIPISW